MATTAYRTPDECFSGLPDFPYDPSYRTVGDLRVAHVDVGDGPPVVLIHGEPSWSFVWRKMIPLLCEGGYRCIAPDHVGFGRSDKPLDPGWQSLKRHVAVTRSLFEELDLRNATVVCHDWGGPIGLTVATMLPDRISRLVILDTVMDLSEAWASDTWVTFRRFVEESDDIPAGELMAATCVRGLSAQAIAAYDAPFPTVEAKAALWGLPMSVPAGDDEEARAALAAVCAALRADERPMLMCWGMSDLILTLASGERLATKLGHRIDHPIADAGHGLPEDAGPELARLMLDWLSA